MSAEIETQPTETPEVEAPEVQKLETEGAETEGGEGTQENAEPKPPAMIPRARFNQVLHRAKAAEEALRALQMPQQAPPQPAKPAEKLDPAKFSSLEEYETAVRREAAEEARRQILEEFQAESQTKEARKLLTEFNARLTTAAKENPEYVEAFEYLDSPAVADRLDVGVGAALLESEVGPQLMREIAFNPEILQRIIDQPARTALREIGRLEAKILSQKDAKSATPPPPPLRTTTGIKGSAPVTKDLNDPNLSMEEFSKLFDKTTGKRFRR